MIGNIGSMDCAASTQDMSSSTGTSKKSVIEQIMDKLIDNFAKSYSKTEDPTEKEKAKEAAIKDIVSKADTDKDGSLSKAELSEFAKTEEGSGNKVLNELISSFDSLDKNKDGKLSLDEMKELLKKKEFSLQELKAINEDFNCQNNSKNILDLAGKSSPLLTQKIIDNYGS